MKKYYKKVGRTAKYIAAPVPGVFDSIPSWFQLLVEEGSLRYDKEGMIQIKLITGVWQTAHSGEVIVLQQRGDEQGIVRLRGDVYLVEQEDFAKLWQEI